MEGWSQPKVWIFPIKVSSLIGTRRWHAPGAGWCHSCFRLGHLPTGRCDKPTTKHAHIR